MKISKIMIIVLLAVLSISFTLEAKTKSFAWVKLFAGRIKIQPEGKSSWYEPKIGMALREGDVIQTMERSWITIAYENSTITRVLPNSEITITKIDYNEKTKDLDAKVKVSGLGKLLSVIRKVLKGSEVEYNVETPTSVAGVRGTDIMVDVPNKDTTVFAVFDGKVIVKDFVTETGLSTDDTTMMMDFLHEMSVGGGKYTVYDKDKGFKNAKSIGDKFKTSQKTLKDMDKESKELAKALEKGKPEDRQDKAEQIREDVIK
ncbi:MAG: FecR domain-containing protein [Spirochaetes bacterium]|nr:FecR domain-containing protein [Spirochaetota bacterium]